MSILVPKMSHHFRVHFDGFDSDDTTQVLRVTRPSLRFHNDFGISEVSLAPIELDLRDDASDHTRSAVIRQIIKQIKDDAKFAMVIETRALDTTVLEQWRLHGCRIVDYQLDELNYAKGDPLIIHLKLDCERINVSLDGEMVEMLSGC